MIRLNRPERLNAINLEMKDELIRVLAEAAGEEGPGAVVITGAGSAFSAGGDLDVFARLYESGRADLTESFTDLALPRAFLDFPKPLIAAINGPAVGWGFTMPLTCDLRLASRTAVLSCGFVKVGLTPEFGSSCLLPRLIGLGRALDLALTARRITAAEALDLGLVSQVVEPEELLGRALDLGRQIAALPGPAVRLAKRIIRLGAQSSLEETLGPELDAFREALATPEHYRALKEMMAGIRAKKV